MAQFAIDEVLTTGIQISGFIFDYSSSLGTPGQVLASTSSGVMWQADSSIVDLSSLSGQIAATGSLLNNRINSLSGYSDATFATITNLATTGSTLDTKINTLSGYSNQTFLSGVGVANYVPRWNTSKQLVTGNIYDNGNVGIGTASPNTKLRVNGSFSHRPSGSSNIQEYKNIVTYNLDNNGNGGYVVKTPFQIGNSYEMAIVHVKGYGYANASLYDFKVVFYDYGPSSGPVNYSLIDLGNDGSPKYLAKDANNYVQVCFGNTTDVNNYYYRFTVDCITTRHDGDYSQGWGMYQTTGTNFGFASTGVYQLDSPVNFNVATNYVGIGKTNPACQLDVVGTIRSSTNQIYGFGANDSVSLRANSSVNVLGIYTSNVERLRVDANGYLGIGLAPSTLLSVGGAGSTSAASGITFGGDASANLYRISSSRIKTDGSLEVAVGIISPTITSLSGNIAATGSALDTKINTLSGYSNATFATITNLAATGSTLDTKINTLSGYSNSSFATILNLAATGSALDTKINTTNTNLAATGSTLDTKINTTNTNLATTNTNLAATGSTLDTKINTLSGYSNSTFATILNLAATGSTLDTKINALSGYSDATFATITNLAATGSTLNTKINTLSGYSNQTFLSGVGVSNYVPRWSGTKLLVTGNIYDNGTNVSIGAANPSVKLAVNGEASFGDGSKLTLIGLDINDNTTPSFIKIRTKIPFVSASADFTVNIKGFKYGTAETTNLSICWHYYNSTFYNPTISSAGSFAPIVKLSAEDWDSSGTPKVCIVLVGPGYYPKLYVESMYSSNYNDEYADGWDWVDADATGTGNGLAILSYKSNFGNSFVMLNNGAVGVGRSAPTQMLDVGGYIMAGEGSYRTSIYGSNGGAWISFGDTGVLDSLGRIGAYGALFNINSLNGATSFQYNGSEKMRITTAGLVGIGTNSPTTLLSVGGAGSTLPASGITFGGDSVVNLYRLSDSVLKTDAAFTAASLSSSSYVYASTYLQTAGGQLYAGAPYGTLTVYVGNTAQNAWEAGLYVGRGSYVGIGTTQPSGKLHVVSSVAGETVLRADGTNGTLFSVVDDLSDSLMSVNNSAGLPVLEVFADDRVVAGQYGSGDFVIINNKVGIGTTNPAYKLEVNGNFAAGGTSTIGTTYPQLTINGATNQHAYVVINRTNYEAGVQLRTNGTAKWYMYMPPADDTTLRFNSQAYGDSLTIKNNGNVGIGTTNPSFKLHTAGAGFIGRQNSYGSYDAADADLIISNYNVDNTSILLFNNAGAYHSSLINYYNNILSLGLNNDNGSNLILTSTAINITAAGVGIGTSVITGLLNVTRNSNTAQPIAFFKELYGSPAATNILLLERGNNLSAADQTSSNAGLRIRDHSSNYSLSIEDHNSNVNFAISGSKVLVGSRGTNSLLNVGEAGSVAAASGLTFGEDASANLYRSAASTIKTDGNLVVAGTTSLNGHIYGKKTVTLTTASYTTVLTVNLTAHNSCYVKIGAFGDWTNHSAVAFVSELFIQNGDNAGYGEPGTIITAHDNTAGAAGDKIDIQIVDPLAAGTQNFLIQLKLISATLSTNSSIITYHVMGQQASVT